jgi:hypothetical protein
MASYEVISERNDEVFVFNVLPEFCTRNTSMDYFRKFPYFDEEIYYILECASLENADTTELVKTCQDIVDKRNKELLAKLDNSRKPNEIDVSLEDDFMFYVAKYDDSCAGGDTSCACAKHEILSSINDECATSVPPVSVQYEETKRDV